MSEKFSKGALNHKQINFQINISGEAITLDELHIWVDALSNVKCVSPTI